MKPDDIIVYRSGDMIMAGERTLEYTNKTSQVIEFPQRLELPQHQQFDTQSHEYDYRLEVAVPKRWKVQAMTYMFRWMPGESLIVPAWMHLAIHQIWCKPGETSHEKTCYPQQMGWCRRPWDIQSPKAVIMGGLGIRLVMTNPEQRYTIDERLKKVIDARDPGALPGPDGGPGPGSDGASALERARARRKAGAK